MNSSKLSKAQIETLKFIANELSKMKSINDLEIFNDKMKLIIEKSGTIPLLVIQKFAILFFSFYNNLIVKEQNQFNQKLIHLADFMINNFRQKDLLTLINNEIDSSFCEEDFKNIKIFSDKYREKDPLEICFTISILSKNIKIMKIFFHEYLKMYLFNDDKFNLINLENPFTYKLFVDLFNKIYKSKKINEMNNLNSMIQNIINDSNNSEYNMYRCSKCYDIMLMKLNANNNFEIKCLNCDKKFKEYTQFEANKTFL